MTAQRADAPAGWATNFNVFWAGQTLSALGDAVAVIALPLVALQATGSIARMGLLSAAGLAGNLVAGLAGGSLADRLDRRRLMIACDAARALLWGSVPLVWQLVGPHFALLVPIAFLGGLFGGVFQITCLAVPASLVPTDQVTTANSKLVGGYAAMFAVGPVLSGIVARHLGSVAAIGLDAATFAVSAGSIYFVHIAPVDRTPDHANERRSVELLAGARFVLGHPVLRPMMVLSLVLNCIVAARIELLVFVLRRDLHRSDDEVGAFFGLSALGALAASLAVPALRRRVRVGPAWLALAGLGGLCALGLGLASGVASAAALCVGFLFADAARAILSASYRQQITPPQLLGRVTAVLWLGMYTLAPAGVLLTTGLAAAIGVRPTLVAMGLATLATVLAGGFTALRTETDAPPAGS